MISAPARKHTVLSRVLSAYDRQLLNRRLKLKKKETLLKNADPPITKPPPFCMCFPTATVNVSRQTPSSRLALPPVPSSVNTSKSRRRKHTSAGAVTGSQDGSPPPVKMGHYLNKFLSPTVADPADGVGVGLRHGRGGGRAASGALDVRAVLGHGRAGLAHHKHAAHAETKK